MLKGSDDDHLRPNKAAETGPMCMGGSLRFWTRFRMTHTSKDDQTHLDLETQDIGTDWSGCQRRTGHCAVFTVISRWHRFLLHASCTPHTEL